MILQPSGNMVSIRLAESDWRDLVNFVTGDLHNMDPDCEVRKQMGQILDAIERKCNESKTK